MIGIQFTILRFESSCPMTVFDAQPRIMSGNRRRIPQSTSGASRRVRDTSLSLNIQRTIRTRTFITPCSVRRSTIFIFAFMTSVSWPNWTGGYPTIRRVINRTLIILCSRRFGAQAGVLSRAGLGMGTPPRAPIRDSTESMWPANHTRSPTFNAVDRAIAMDQTNQLDR